MTKRERNQQMAAAGSIGAEMFVELIARPDIDLAALFPGRLESMATVLELAGYTEDAAALRAKYNLTKGW